MVLTNCTHLVLSLNAVEFHVHALCGTLHSNRRFPLMGSLGFFWRVR